MKTIVFDMDGTLANIDERRKYLEQTPKDWDSFNTKMDTDRPNFDICELSQIYDTAGYKIIIFTGRFESTRITTADQLRRWKVNFIRLTMRQDDDFRSDYDIKEEMYKQALRSGFDIKIAVDDRDQVVEMWRNNGIRCLQVDYGNF